MILSFLLPGCARFKPHYPPKTLRSATTKVSAENLTTISVVIPSYNQSRYLEQTLWSLLNQKYDHLEIIVVDGGSNDGSLDIIKKYSSRLSWWISEPDRGQAHAINKGFAQSSGSVMAWLNSDDILMPGALHRISKIFSANQNIDAVYGQRIIVNSDGNDIGKWILPGHDDGVLPYADYIPQETLFWRRELWERAGGTLDESFQFALDWDLILRFRDSGATFKCVNSFLGAFRRHEAQKTIANISSTGFEEMDRLRAQYRVHKSDRVNWIIMRFNLVRFLAKAKVYEALWKLGLIEIY